VFKLSEKEFKKEEYKIELKLVALVSVNEINELKNTIPELIKKRIEHYNYPYIMEKDKLIKINTMNMRAYISCSISNYVDINEEEKLFINNEVAQVRNNIREEFTKEQTEKISEIYRKLEKEINNTFNNSPLFEVKFHLHNNLLGIKEGSE